MLLSSESVPRPCAVPLLLADNSPHGRLVRRSLLVAAGYLVTVVSSATAALAALHAEPFAVLVLDESLPDLTGLELVTAVRQDWPGLPTVLVSSLVDVLGLTPTTTGAAAVVAKDAREAERLVQAVQRLLTPRKQPGSAKPRTLTAARWA